MVSSSLDCVSTLDCEIWSFYQDCHCWVEEYAISSLYIFASPKWVQNSSFAHPLHTREEVRLNAGDIHKAVSILSLLLPT